MWSALAKDFSKLADSVRGESRVLVDMLNEITSDVVSTKSTYAGDEDFFCAMFPSNRGQGHRFGQKAHCYEDAQHSAEGSCGAAVLNTKDLQTLQESDDTYTRVISTEEQPAFESWAVTNAMSSRRIRSGSGTTEHRSTDGNNTCSSGNDTIDNRNNKDEHDSVAEHTGVTQGGNVMDDLAQTRVVAEDKLYKARLRLLNYNSTVQAKYDRFAGEDPRIGRVTSAEEKENAPGTKDDHGVAESATAAEKVEPEHPQQGREQEYHVGTSLSPDDFFDRYFFRLHQLRKRANEQAISCAAAAASAASMASEGNAAQHDMAARNSSSGAVNSGHSVDENSKDEHQSVSYKRGKSESNNDGVKCQRDTTDGSEAERDDATDSSQTSDRAHCGEQSQGSARSGKSEGPSLQNFAAHMLRRASEFMSTIEDAVDLIDEDSSDSDDFNVSLHNLSDNTSTNANNMDASKQSNRRNEENQDDVCVRAGSHARSREVDERIGRASELTGQSEYVSPLELVVQELQSALRAERERVARLTQLLHEHQISIPDEWMGSDATHTSSMEQCRRAIRMPHVPPDQLHSNHHNIYVDPETSISRNTDTAKQSVLMSEESSVPVMGPQKSGGGGESGNSAGSANEGVVLPQYSQSVDVNKYTEAQELSINSSNISSGWDELSERNDVNL